MDLGAIVLLDALGFKGIWGRQNARAVLECLKSLRRRGLQLQGKRRDGVLLSDSGFRHRVRCMSDTIVITVVVKGPKAPTRGLYRAMLSASMIAGDIMFHALHGSPALIFRGCLAAGEMKEEADFLIGPAVDEAAERFETADGPFLWLAPSALKITRRYADTFPDRLEPTVMLPFRVPLNDGTDIRTQAFTYFGVVREAEARADTRKRLLEAFGKEPLAQGVRTKRQNAERFMDYVERFAGAGRWKKRRWILRRPHWKDLSPSQRMKLLIRGIHWD